MTRFVIPLCMDASVMQLRQGHRLIQLGIALLLFASFEGFVIPRAASPHLALSAHTLSALLTVLLTAFGLVWPRLRLGAMSLRIAYWCLIYSSLAILAAYVLAAVWGAGNMTMRIAAGSARGSAVQELTIMVLAFSSAPTGIVSFALMLWGLRRMTE
jgi:hydroxylaminobenzene mutase